MLTFDFQEGEISTSRGDITTLQSPLPYPVKVLFAVGYSFIFIVTTATVIITLHPAWCIFSSNILIPQPGPRQPRNEDDSSSKLRLLSRLKATVSYPLEGWAWLHVQVRPLLSLWPLFFHTPITTDSPSDSPSTFLILLPPGPWL